MLVDEDAGGLLVQLDGVGGGLGLLLLLEARGGACLCRGGLDGGELCEHCLHLGLGLGGELLPDGAVLGLAVGALLGGFASTRGGFGVFLGAGGSIEELPGVPRGTLPVP